MAEQLIVLGNGFDLATDIKSDYKSFIQYILQAQSITDKDISEVIDTVRNIEKGHLELKVRDFLDDGQLSTLLKLNPWYWLLLINKRVQDYDWANIELEIKNILISNPITRSPQEISAQFVPNQRLTDNEKDQLLVSRLLYFIKSANQEKDDINDKTNIYEWLYIKLNEVETDFEKYLIDQLGITKNGKPNVEFIALQYRLLNRIISSNVYLNENSNSGGSDFNYNILNFNYTNIYDQRYWKPPFNISGSLISKPTKTLNVHGLINLKNDNDTDTYSHIIFGIDNKNIKPDSPVYTFTKTYRTLLASSDKRQMYSQPNSDVFDANVKIIKFFGHSLGEADYSYFQQMFDFYKLYDNQSIKLYFYFTIHDDIPEFELARSQVESVVNLIETYGTTLSNPARGKNLLTRLQATKRIIIKAIR